MNRQEEIRNAAIDYAEIEDNCLVYDDCGDVCDDRIFIERSFEEGAKWSDKTLITKACEYLKGLVYQEYSSGPIERLFDDEMIKDFRKAMEK